MITLDAPFDDSVVIAITPTDPASKQFAIGQKGTPNSGSPRADECVSFGYNYIPGGRISNTEYGFGLMMESYYQPLTFPQVEVYYELIDNLGVAKRPWAFAWRPETGTVTIEQRAGSHTWATADGSVTYSTLSAGLWDIETALFVNSNGRFNGALGVGVTSGTVLPSTVYIKGSTNSVNIRLENTSGVGRKYELNAYTDGKLYLGDNTAGATRLIMDANGNFIFFAGIKAGNIVQSPPASVSPSLNGEMVVEATSDTVLTFKLKGSDGTTRSGVLTLS